MLVTKGGRFGGYALYLLKSKPVFDYNMLDLKRYRWEGPEVLSPGKHTITCDFQYDGPGFGKGGTGVLRVDNNEVAIQTIPHTISFIVRLEETFDAVLAHLWWRKEGAGTACRQGSPTTVMASHLLIASVSRLTWACPGAIL